MSNMIVKRLLGSLPVLFVVALLIFFVLRLAAGDPAAVIAGDKATAADIERIREQFGLTGPVWKQFLIWLGRVLQGDLGHSYYMRQDVADLIARRIVPTLSLAGGTILISTLVAVPLGTVVATRPGGWLDRLVMSGSVAAFSIPVFIVGYLLIWFFGLHLRWFPVQGYVAPSVSLAGWLHRLVLPCLTLSVMFIALIARVTRASVMDALGEEHVRTARAKGLPEWQVVLRHALNNAAVPIVTIIGISVALLIGGVVVTETIFAIPGLGMLTVDAILNRDFPTVQGVVLFFSVVYVAINLIVDLTYLLLDPRIRS